MQNKKDNSTHGALLGIDLGTTGLKAVIYQDGRAAGKGYCTYPIHTPQSGFAEQEPDEWAKAMAYSVKQALREAELDASEIKAVGFSGQMHGTVMLDEAGLPVYPAIIWCDTRSGEQCGYITEKIGKERFYNITQNNIACGFQASSLLWVKQNRPEIYSRIKYVISPKDYIRKLLCGNIKIVNEKLDEGGGHGASGTISKLVKSGDDVYDIFSGSSYITAPLGLSGTFYNLHEIKYLDLTKPYWMQGYIENTQIGNELYSVSGDILLSAMRSSFSVFLIRN